MASLRRSAIVAGTRLFTGGSKSVSLKTLSSPKPIPSSSMFSSSSSSTRPNASAALRIASVLGSVESMMPLHSAIAVARLRSNIAADSTCWSLLSEGLATPL